MSVFLVLLFAAFGAGCAVGAFSVFVLGIRSEERQHTLHGHDAPQTPAGASTRRVLGYVSRPAPDNDVTKFAI